MTPSPHRRFALAALLLAAVSTAATLQAGCGRGANDNGANDNGANANGGTSSAYYAGERAKIAQVTEKVTIRPHGADAAVNVDASGRDLQKGDTILTDAAGEAELSIGDCVKIYLYQQSSLMKGSCRRFDEQLGNRYCSIKGTPAFKDCASNIITESDSAVAAFIGTWASHSYLPNLELSVVLVFEGRAEARPVTDKRETKLGDKTSVGAEHFWFSAPDSRREDLRALKLGLEQRTAYPFKRLPELLARVDLRDLHLDAVAKQAVEDKVVPESVLEFFSTGVSNDLLPREVTPEPTAPSTTPVGDAGGNTRRSGGNNGGNNGRNNGGNNGGDRDAGTRPMPRVEADMDFGVTKINHPKTQTFAGRDGTLLLPGSVTLTGPSNVFHHDLPANPGGTNGLREIKVAFTPADSGQYSGQLSFSDVAGRRYVYQLKGRAAVPGLAFSETILPLSSFAPDRVLRLIKDGEVPFAVGKVYLSPGADKYFSIVDGQDTCSGRDDLVKCAVMVRLRQPYAEAASATEVKGQLIVEHDAPGVRRAFALTGMMSPALGVKPRLQFGSIPADGECERTLSLSIEGGRALTLGPARISGPNAGDFKIVRDDCSSTTLSKVCEITVRFKPSAAAARAAVLTIGYDSGGAPVTHQTQLAGVGKPPTVRFVGSPGFAGRQVGAGPVEKTFVIERADGPPLALERISIAGPGAGDYKVSRENCTQAPVGSRCEVHVAFTPTAEGAREAELVVVGPPASDTADDARGPCPETYRLALGGRGHAAWRTKPERDICFGEKSVTKGRDKKPRTAILKVESESLRPLKPEYRIEGEAEDDFTVVSDNCPGANKSCEIKIQFKPTAEKPRSAALVLRPDDDTPPARVELFGRGHSGHPVKRFGRWFVGLFVDRGQRACRK